ncbi:MAG TPA: hypothetical protein VGI95_07395 [Caulobacteraceae bacterium]|jgi:hypothetical protein
MSDEKKPEAADKDVDHFQEHLNAPHHQAKKGVSDAGEIVSSAGGELIDGRIADITDGDKPRRRH